ncbi:MAG: ribbon-helix-helix protein, CopG family [Verrucomicrobiota bacterium]|jgi:metal-responsive CopG/Arc/MetJ family transcriptional regulator
MKRSAGKKPKGKLLAVWVPGMLLTRLDQGARKEDSDRSKFVRNAIREKLARHGQPGE